MIKVIHGEIWGEDFTQLNQLIKEFQSCVRFAYNRFHKDNLEFNDVRKACKAKYPTLNTRQVSDAVVQGQALQTRHKDEKIIFGGRKAWEDLKAGNITKEEWLLRRDNQIYFRGDKTQKGNLNIRIVGVVGDYLRITVGTRQWQIYKLVETKTLTNNRILYASRDKRDYDIGCLVKQIIGYSKEHNKGIVFEDLKFEKDFKPYEKNWNRKKSNFVWKKFITLLERKCIEHGIEYRKVNPAFTSIIGKYKYRWMHKLSIHESAAYVIGRRGLGYNEKLSFYKQEAGAVKAILLRTLAGKYQGVKHHSWRLWKALNDNVETVLTGLRVSLADLKEFAGNIRYKSGNLLGEIFLLELLAGSRT